MERWWTPPNLLSFLRILLTPWIARELLALNYPTALGLLFVSGISDAIDGWLARRCGWESRLGALLDPLADKLQIVTAYSCFGVTGALPWWLVALVFARDLLILAFAAVALAFTTLRSFPPSPWGKLSTFFQLALGGSIVLAAVLPFLPFLLLRDALFWLTVPATIWSGLHYAWTAARLLRAART
jgi:cardiolipin synthase